jgi:UDP-N-acetylmuramate dehydrogenase
VELRNEDELQHLISNDVRINNPHLLLGGWANILFAKDYEGLVVKINLKWRELIAEKWWIILAKVGAGEDWHETMMWLLEQWYVWWENLVAIPWTVWAAPLGNIWAYGKEAKDIIYTVEWIDLISWEKKIFTNEDCDFAYRDSIFKHELAGRFLITSVTFQLQKDHPNYQPNTDYKDVQQAIASQWLEKPSALEVAHIIIEIRKNKLPDRHNVWTAGSFFKNPIVEKSAYENLLQKYPDLIWRPIENSELWTIHSTLTKLSAGQLIELAELKWYRQWYVGTSEKHALILINYEWWTWADIVQFAELIQKKVLVQFAVQLEPEVLYV